MSITYTRDEDYIHLIYRDIYLDDAYDHTTISFWQKYRNTLTDEHPVYERTSDFRIRVIHWKDVTETLREDHKFISKRRIRPDGEFEIYTDINVANYVWWFIKRQNPDYAALDKLCHKENLKEKVNPALYNNLRIFKSDD